MSAAEDDSEIVVGCHLSIGEFGYEAIDLCVKQNLAAREEVRRYPEAVRGIVARCTHRWEPGWVQVKRCIDDDIAAAPLLEAYAQDHAEKVQSCRERFHRRGDHRVRICVERAIEAEKDGGQR
ncbi:MAG TPA: hypothetical protein VNM24_07945 [Burkholderiales bacterium]|nr:hypothetical protein [Burkholderiales bacterium]